MYVCICVCMCVCMCVCVYALMYVCINVCMCVCNTMYICIIVYVGLCIHLCISLGNGIGHLVNIAKRVDVRPSCQRLTLIVATPNVGCSTGLILLRSLRLFLTSYILSFSSSILTFDPMNNGS